MFVLQHHQPHRFPIFPQQVAQPQGRVVVIVRKWLRFAVNLPKRLLRVSQKKVGVIGQYALDQAVAQADLELRV